jgi:nucleotide-binding universal stress UspA family protein
MKHGEGMDHGPQNRDHLHDDCNDPVNARVVVGVDGSDTSWDAFCWACGEAGRLGGHIVAVFVDVGFGVVSATATAPFAGAAVPYGVIQQSMIDQAEELDLQVRSYGHDHGVDVAFIHCQGDPTRELLRIANADHADLLVVGRSTKSRHHLAGSLGRRLVGKRGAPVIVVVP